MGTGACQLWIDEPTDGGSVVDFVPADELPSGWLAVAAARDDTGRPYLLAHADDAALARFALFDAVLGYDLGRASDAMKGFSLALNAANLFDKRHVTACPFNNSCYFGAGRTVIGSLRFNW